jgi:4-amino-4-deoxy-L-arabinose transferase-like glycosyltransferase
MDSQSRLRPTLCLAASAALLAAGLIWCAVRLSFSWDEGFHLVAAQLIAHGRRPYLDFCFAQAPLNAYWNALLMKLFGESWRVVHVAAAIETAGAVYLTADFLLARWDTARWRLWAAITAAVLCGLNPQTVRYGEVGQAYGLCLFLIVAAFRMAVEAVARERVAWAAGAGFLAAAAAGSSLLTAPVAPVIALWMLLANRAGNRWTKLCATVAGGVAAWLPILWLLARAPRIVIFDMFRYHIFYRRSDWEGATEHDLQVLRGWMYSPTAILLGLLAIAGLWYAARRSEWERGRRAELYLCAALGLALTAFISTAHPTFERYYLLATPFFAILAAIGLYAIATRTGAAERPWWPVLTVAVVMGAALRWNIVEWRDEMHWNEIEPLAQKVDAVTAPGAALYADEHVYFLTRRAPPSGMEYLSSHKVRLEPELSREVHIVPQEEWDRRIAAGEFDTLQTCDGEDWIKEHNLSVVYVNRADVGECSVFWKPKGGGL